ncbi:Cholecystokinin receptor [Eumeta japonica]|uniref:Cholecystokinin receptor n=1 Tax=Eumeta variegata TaxID=151549 RepID=A0A4C1WLL1_EUMVA|nr:Cholecystokinin receptor [Eumeta japonica]
MAFKTVSASEQETFANNTFAQISTASRLHPSRYSRRGLFGGEHGQLVTAALEQSLPQRINQCVAGLSFTNKISVEEGSGLLEEGCGVKEGDTHLTGIDQKKEEAEEKRLEPATKRCCMQALELDLRHVVRSTHIDKSIEAKRKLHRVPSLAARHSERDMILIIIPNNGCVHPTPRRRSLIDSPLSARHETRYACRYGNMPTSTLSFLGFRTQWHRRDPISEALPSIRLSIAADPADVDLHVLVGDLPICNGMTTMPAASSACRMPRIQEGIWKTEFLDDRIKDRMATWIYLFYPEQLYNYIGSKGIILLQLLAYCSSCCNPITYCFMNRKFKQAFIGLFKTCRLFRSRVKRLKPSMLARRNMSEAAKNRCHQCGDSIGE